MQTLPYLLVQANIPRLEAHIKYIEAFHYSEDAGNELENYLANLKIARQCILDFRLKREPQSFTSNDKAELELQIQEFEPKQSDAKEDQTKFNEVETYSDDSEDRMDYMLQNLE